MGRNSFGDIFLCVAGKIILKWILDKLDIVTCRPTARERLDKQARNKYATNNTVDPFLGNARNTCTQQ
jgi:hypothetical protein